MSYHSFSYEKPSLISCYFQDKVKPSSKSFCLWLRPFNAFTSTKLIHHHPLCFPLPSGFVQCHTLFPKPPMEMLTIFYWLTQILPEAGCHPPSLNALFLSGFWNTRNLCNAEGSYYISSWFARSIMGTGTCIPRKCSWGTFKSLT